MHRQLLPLGIINPLIGRKPMPYYHNFDKEVALIFRDQLREARLNAQKDAEAFDGVLFVLERLGCYLSRQSGGLRKFQDDIVALASRSPLFAAVPDVHREMHIPFPQLYEFVREARNSAMHENAVARYATSHAVELALVLENALMNGYDKISDFMVRDVLCAEMWQPLSFIRQRMLASSFSCLPVRLSISGRPVWHLVSDQAIARYLRLRSKGLLQKDRLVQPLAEAIAGDEGIKLTLARTYPPSASVTEVLETWDGQPVLVTRKNTEGLLGILSPYDLL
jgi:hypothetical protein